MRISRRSFIRWVLGSAAASACPFPPAASGAPAGIPPGRLGGEANEVCHRVRDGEMGRWPEPSKTVDVAVVGGGPSGLAAADELQDLDFLLLEKEGHVGGNAYAESWEGRLYSTGAAWASIFSPEVEALFKRWKFDLKPIRGLDPACFEGTWIKDFWDGRPDSPSIDKLPYPEDVKRSFRDFCRELQALDLDKDAEELDRRPFAEFLSGRAPQLKAYWDGFGPSNWGCTTEETSAYLGLQAAKQWPREQRYTWEGGMGIASRRIYEHLSERARGRVWLNTTVTRVRRRKDRVWVSFIRDGKHEAVAARAVVMAAPKYIAKFLVEDLPDDQKAAMGSIQYAPFPVYNLCFDRVVYNQGYDNWVVGARHFTDFVQADWVTYADGGDLDRRQVLTMYAPRPERERRDLLDDGKTLAKAQAAVEELLALFPSWTESLAEVRIYRRGHPLPKATPGYHTRLQPLASRDLPPVYFAHSDSMGEISDVAYAGLAGVAAARKAVRHL